LCHTVAFRVDEIAARMAGRPVLIRQLLVVGQLLVDRGRVVSV
jgi:hypothetical protein